MAQPTRTNVPSFKFGARLRASYPMPESSRRARQGIHDGTYVLFNRLCMPAYVFTY